MPYENRGKNDKTQKTNPDIKIAILKEGRTAKL